ncbi:MAG: terminase large subunit domain-containing protein [Sodalis sp. (in: enterobacteria)]|uniref:terminase large subunit domain-containing protein n=1 Tax=Sodalis sp. (in: enterobacteria) TaxID=1898979 RepID=UPI003F303AF8
MSAALPLYLYQQRWFLDRSRFKNGQFARQTGKTFTTTLELVDDCFETEDRGGRTRRVILSRGERQAKEAMEEGAKSIVRRTVWPSVKSKAA